MGKTVTKSHQDAETASGEANVEEIKLIKDLAKKEKRLQEEKSLAEELQKRIIK